MKLELICSTETNMIRPNALFSISPPQDIHNGLFASLMLVNKVWNYLLFGYWKGLKNSVYAVLWLVLNRISTTIYPVEIPFRALLFVGISSDHNFFCSMTHYDITIGNDVARDVISLLWAPINMLQCILMMLWPSFIMYYYAQLWYFCFLSKIFKNCTLNINIIKTKVARHKNKNQFVMYPCLEIRFIVFVKGYFYRLLL